MIKWALELDDSAVNLIVRYYYYNFVGEPIYEIGEAASHCPEGEVDNDGLCSQG